MRNGNQGQAAGSGFRDGGQVVEGIVVVAARWLQLAAIFWLTLLSPRYGSSFPRPVGDVLYWFSWLAMALGSFTLIAVAWRRPDFRSSLILSAVLLWTFLGIGLAFR